MTTLCVCAIVKDELPYLLEWLAHHLLAGVTSFRIYDNESTDGTTEMLAALSRRYPIEVVGWPAVEGRSPQLGAYNAGLQALRGACDFVAFIDVDEFLFAFPTADIGDALAKFSPDTGAIAINQRVFGSAGHEHYGADLVTSRFTLRAPVQYSENRYVKTICRPEFVDEIANVHRVVPARGLYVSSTQKILDTDDRNRGEIGTVCEGEIRQHHYILKSREEFEQKRRRGGVSAPTKELRLGRYRDDGFFSGREPFINAEQDNVLAMRRPAVVALMQEMFAVTEAAMNDRARAIYRQIFARGDALVLDA